MVHLFLYSLIFQIDVHIYIYFFSCIEFGRIGILRLSDMSLKLFSGSSVFFRILPRGDPQPNSPFEIRSRPRRRA